MCESPCAHHAPTALLLTRHVCPAYWYGALRALACLACRALQGEEGARLQGTVPASGWELPDQIETLDLRRNNISGPLPAEWKLPQQLKYFALR